jgi:hypothetical protein
MYDLCSSTTLWKVDLFEGIPNPLTLNVTIMENPPMGHGL